LKDQENILKQYAGFLSTPQIFKTTNTLKAKIFQTLEVVDFTEIEGLIHELSRQKYLGKRAELFLLQYLKSSGRYNQITHSLQIRNDSTTLGEVDVICFDNKRQKWIHIELVYKLYVFVGESDYDDFTQWIGPNLKDRLAYKIEKLKSHQLPLGQHPKILEKIGESQLESYCCYKAKLFLKSPNERLKSDLINDDCLCGHYINFEEFKTLKYNKTLFYVPEKGDWLCDASEHSRWYNFEKAEATLKPSIKDKRARLVWQKTFTGEVLEYFVVWW
jgi:hypothetical protein